MKLNPDCVRDILLGCEELCTLTDVATFHGGEPYSIDERTYQADELFYHLNQCDLSGYFTESSWDVFGDYSVRDLTPKAHEFLANIRDDTVWNSVKGVAGKVGSKSLGVLTQIASSVMSEIVKSYLRASGIIV